MKFYILLNTSCICILICTLGHLIFTLICASVYLLYVLLYVHLSVHLFVYLYHTSQQIKVNCQEAVAADKDDDTGDRGQVEECLKRLLFEAKLKPTTNAMCMKVSFHAWNLYATVTFIHAIEMQHFIFCLPNNSVVVQELVRVLAENKADVHIDPILYRACALDLQHYCKDIPRGEGRRTFDLIIVTLSSTIQKCVATLIIVTLFNSHPVYSSTAIHRMANLYFPLIAISCRPLTYGAVGSLLLSGSWTRQPGFISFRCL